MNELHLQEHFLVQFFVNDLKYREVKANTHMDDHHVNLEDNVKNTVV